MGNSQKETLIKSNRRLFDLELTDFFRYKDLLYLLVRRDLVTSYKQTILGPFWVVIQSLMGTAVFTVIFGEIAKISTDGHPSFLFYLSGMIGWQYFGSVMGLGACSLQANLNLFSKVYFPRLIPPISQSISALLNFVIQLLVFYLALLVHNQATSQAGITIDYKIIFIPLLVLQSAIFGLGIGFIFSALSTKYRDFSRISGQFTQLIMYGTPVIYPASAIPNQYEFLMMWNPLAFILESYREILLGHSTACNLEHALPSILVTLVIFFCGLVLYNKAQRTYVDFV